METLLKQLKELPARFLAMPAGLRIALIAGVGLAVAVALSVAGVARSGEYQYAFTNLTQEDSTEATGILQNAGIPFRSEANGTALAVPADKVYDSRILLATAGLPRGGGVGFELFDRGDLGVSEFTQKVNLRRAIEGELARTIGNFSGVRSARVTVSLGEHGLYRDEDKKAAASVVVVLQPGRTLGDRELAGIRHLVSSSTPGLAADAVTVMDGRGAVLSADSAWDAPEASYQRKLEHAFEQQIITLLEPVVGAGAVIAKVTATVDNSTVNQNSEVFDPDQVALRSERTASGNTSNQTNTPAGVAGAQANVPLAPQPPQQGPTQQGNSQTSDLTKNFEITKTTTQTQVRHPRLTKISVAVIVDGADGKARTPEEVTKLGELARKAVGFDDARGDQFEITSQLFGRSAEVPEVKPVAATVAAWVYGAVAGGVLLLAALAFFLSRRASNAKGKLQTLVLKPGETVSQLEARQAAVDGIVTAVKKEEPPLLVDPLADLKDRARALVREDPERALMLVRAWLSSDLEKGTEHHG
ncbi:MAG: flagellar basal-body MS-ring/collar protein FliF [Archangium sp.]|nr:flagellar basal-body MS-ring/collar protein FliF [Archangium sp.]